MSDWQWVMNEISNQPVSFPTPEAAYQAYHSWLIAHHSSLIYSPPLPADTLFGILDCVTQLINLVSNLISQCEVS
jgi:hypothetical protein